MSDDVLSKYASKRKFDETPEPAPALGEGAERLRFVIHKHAARALHYDIRLELDGVLLSWACPKGPSLDPAVKRLAVRVEDHPLDYRDFEGIIPEGNYGAGGVIIWDRGWYSHPSLPADKTESEKLLRAGLNKGDLKFVLSGEKLKGEFALVKTGKDDKSWLLLKKKDLHATGEEVLAKNLSVASGLSLEEILADGVGNPARSKKIDSLRFRETLEAELTDAPIAPMPLAVRPMLATPAKEPFDHPDWIFEMKWDGYRAIAEIGHSGVSLYSRNLLQLGEKFPPITEALRELHFNAVLDGEVVVVDDQGRPNFQLLQNYGKSRSGHLLYYAFDILHLEGRDLTRLPLLKRKEILKKIIPPNSLVRFSDHVAADGSLFYKVVETKKLEGIVAKHSKSTYETGLRSRNWLKIKSPPLTIDGVIAGFTEPRGARVGFGALILGAYRDGKLSCIGSVGGGFTIAELEEIHMRLLALPRGQKPFTVGPKTTSTVSWVKPVLVCEVAFKGWTTEGYMRHPVFVRMRDDKPASEAMLESGERGNS